MSRRPSFQFYPSDWRKESGLRLCSMGARGLWAEMLCLMHEGEPYGHLTYQGRAIEPASLARLVGDSPAAVKRWLDELAYNTVYSVNENGVIFSRRMVRDEDLRERRAAGGSAGAEHGRKGGEHGAKGGRPRKEKTPDESGGRGDNNGQEKPPLKPPPSSSSSSSEESPVADATAADPPVDPEKVIFDQGLKLLAEGGVREARARPILGKWKRDFGAEAVIVALGRAQRHGAIDPISFVEGCLRNGGQNGQRIGGNADLYADRMRDPVLGEIAGRARP